jgi:hypothetical protein
MTTADGRVLGVTQIFGSALRRTAFNVVLLGDGFTSTQQGALNDAADDFVRTLRATPPFGELEAGINVFRVNVTSTDSGADDPASAGGTGATARTYFDATFGGNGIRRLLLCNFTTVLTVAAAQVPEFTVALLVVNSTIYGGAGGSAGTYSLAPGATDIAMHELGHTAFGLADEYDYYSGGDEPGRARHPGPEPGAPNVTLNTNPATLKWRAVVGPGTALPTMSNPDCTRRDTRPSPVPAGTVGLFEGAHYYRCGVYRPEYDCMMRALARPLCRVCTDVIRVRIGPRNPFPHWQLLDNNPGTVAIAADHNSLYQRHGTGWVWRYVGTPLTGWQLLDNNAATAQIVAANGRLYQRHHSGRIWLFTGTPMTGWQLLDNNPATVDIVASRGELYQRHTSGAIWRFTGTPLTGWQLLDNNPATVSIIADEDDGRLYQRHASGTIWRYTGTPMTGWQAIDNNPATVEIVASGGNLYQRHRGGAVWRFTGTPMTGWQQLDNNPATVQIAADGALLYQRHRTGALWRYTGVPMTGWRQLDGNSATATIVAARGRLYQLHGSGSIWRYTGT